MDAFPRELGSAVTALYVIAPHPDDDVLGCGALIARVAPELPVHVVYVTDGAASHTGSAAFPPDRLRAVREREARRALRRLGVRTIPHFLRCPDGHVPQAGDSAAAPLLDVLRSALPNDVPIAVAFPWRRDPHCDHRATASLVETVLRERPRATSFEYAVWLGVIGESADAPSPDEGRTVEIAGGRWLRAKRAALQAHRSQLGLLVPDAATAFELPQQLLTRALGPVERFVIPIGAVS